MLDGQFGKTQYLAGDVFFYGEELAKAAAARALGSGVRGMLIPPLPARGAR